MRIINVIEINGGNIENVESFGVFEEQLVDDVSEVAEKHFLNKIKENNGGVELNEDDSEEVLDNGHWETNSGMYYEISIVWSDI